MEHNALAVPQFQISC